MKYRSDYKQSDHSEQSIKGWDQEHMDHIRDRARRAENITYKIEEFRAVSNSHELLEYVDYLWGEYEDFYENNEIVEYHGVSMTRKAAREIDSIWSELEETLS